jgi:hypothetical protein
MTGESISGSSCIYWFLTILAYYRNDGESFPPPASSQDISPSYTIYILISPMFSHPSHHCILHIHTHSPLPLPSLFWAPDWPESRDMHVPIFTLYISSSYTSISLIWPLSDIPASYIVHMQFKFKLTLIAWCTQVDLSISWICMFFHILRYRKIYYKVSTSPRWTALA